MVIQTHTYILKCFKLRYYLVNKQHIVMLYTAYLRLMILIFLRLLFEERNIWHIALFCLPLRKKKIYIQWIVHQIVTWIDVQWCCWNYFYIIAWKIFDRWLLDKLILLAGSVKMNLYNKGWCICSICRSNSHESFVPRWWHHRMICLCSLCICPILINRYLIFCLWQSLQYAFFLIVDVLTMTQYNFCTLHLNSSIFLIHWPWNSSLLMFMLQWEKRLMTHV